MTRLAGEGETVMANDGLVADLSAAERELIACAENWHEALTDDPVDAFKRGRDLYDAIQEYIEARDRLKAAQAKREAAS